MSAFNYINGSLMAENTSVSQLAQQFGTPLYVYSRAALEQHYRAFDEAFASVPHQVCYAVKANSNLAVLNILARLGAGFDIVSGGELARVLAAGGDTIFTMSMLKGIRDFLGGAFGSPAESIMGLPASYVQQAWPTIFGKLARIMDPVRRSTYGETDIEKFKNQWLSKTPIASESLQPKLDIFGREQAQGGAFEQLFSPGYFKEKETDKIMTELYRLYKSTKETDLIPKLAPYKFTDQGKEYRLSPEELTSFQRTMGQANYDDINSLISKDRYKNYTDQEKAIALRKIVEKNYDDAKKDFLKEMAEK